MKKKEIGKGYNKKIYSFFIGALLILLYLIVVNMRNFVGDAGDYWISAEQYGFENFQLINYNSSIRGYLFPLILYFVQRLAQIAGIEGVVVYWIIVSLFFSFTFQVAFPDIVTRCMGNTFSYSLWGKLIFLIIIIYMFKGMFIYPLTDLWALSILICAIWCMLKAENKEMCVGGVMAAIAGSLFAATYFFRPVYLVSLVIAGIIVIIDMVRAKKMIYVSFFAGVILVAVPQMLINHHNFDTWSPVVQTQLFYEDDKSLFLKQLEWGITVQKYETNLDTENYPEVAMRYPENIGVKLLEEEEMEGFDSYWEYICFCFRHIADVCTIYLKHLFNGIDIVYNDIYIYKVYKNRFFIQWLNYTMIFAGINALFQNHKQWDRKQIGWILCWIAPIILVIPTAVETRFFVGVLTLLYFLAIQLFTQEKRKILNLRILAKYVLFIMVCFVLNNAAFSTVGIPIW